MNKITIERSGYTFVESGNFKEFLVRLNGKLVDVIKPMDGEDANQVVNRWFRDRKEK